MRGATWGKPPSHRSGLAVIKSDESIQTYIWVGWASILIGLSSERMVFENRLLDKRSLGLGSWEMKGASLEVGIGSVANLLSKGGDS